MKQKLIILSLFFAGFALNLNAQIDVTVNPISLLFSSFTGGADIGFADDLSAEPIIGFNFNKYDVGDVEYSNTGFRIGAIGKYYFSPDDGCDKWHIGPYVNFSSGKASTDVDGEIDVKSTKLGVGLYIGYKWVSSRNIVFDLGFGGGRNFISEYEFDDGSEVDTGDIPLLNVDIMGKLAVGYRFGGGK